MSHFKWFKNCTSFELPPQNLTFYRKHFVFGKFFKYFYIIICSLSCFNSLFYSLFFCPDALFFVCFLFLFLYSHVIFDFWWTIFLFGNTFFRNFYFEMILSDFFLTCILFSIHHHNWTISILCLNFHSLFMTGNKTHFKNLLQKQINVLFSWII